MGTNFNAKRVTRSYRLTINAKPEKVHSLICPVKEAEWLDGWGYDLIYSESGFAEEGCIFTSKSEGEANTMWIITKRDNNEFETDFIRITPGSRIAYLTTMIKSAGDKKSHVFVSYRFTAITEAGNTFIDNFTENHFITDMKFWQDTMNYYLETGKPLANPNRDNWLQPRDRV